MASPAFRSATSGGDSSGTNISITAPSGLTDNDIIKIILYVETAAAVTITGFTETAGSGQNSGSPTFYQRVFYKRASGEGASWTATWDGSNVWRGYVCAAYSGALTSGDPTEGSVYNENEVGSSVIIGTSINTAGIDRRLIFGGTFAYTSASSFANLSTGTYRANVGALAFISDSEHLISGATGVRTGTANNTEASEWSSVMVALKPADGATGSSINQELYRWRNDDGSQSSATWLANENTDITQPSDTNTRLRVLLDTTADEPAQNYRLDYRLSTESTYRPVTTGTSFAYVASYVQTTGTTIPTTGTTLNMPAGISAGDLLLIWASNDNPAAVILTGSTNTGTWTLLFNRTHPSGSAVSHAAWGRLAIGSNQDRFLLRGAAQDFAAIAFRISNHGVTSVATGSGGLIIGTPQTATGTNPGIASARPWPGNLNPGVTRNWLWLESYASDGISGTTQYWSATFTGSVDWQPISARSTTATRMGIATKQARASSEFPGLMNMTISEQWIANLIGVPPYDERILLTQTSNIAAGGENTTAQLTPPGAKSTSSFTTGRIWDDENGIESLDIASDFYTELEWNLLAPSSVVSNGEVYQFRVTVTGVALDTYTVTPQWTIGTTSTGSEAGFMTLMKNWWGP